jgi:hypothetical protein
MLLKIITQISVPCSLKLWFSCGLYLVYMSIDRRSRSRSRSKVGERAKEVGLFPPDALYGVGWSLWEHLVRIVGRWAWRQLWNYAQIKSMAKTLKKILCFFFFLHKNVYYFMGHCKVRVSLWPWLCPQRSPVLSAHSLGVPMCPRKTNSTVCS